MTQQRHNVVSDAGDGEAYWTGFANIIRIPGEDTGGAFSVIEMRLPPDYSGPPHVHHNEHETFYTVEGEVVYTVGDDRIVGGPDTIVHAPKDVPHSVSNESDTEAITHTWVHPAGFEEFMTRAAPRITDPDDPPELDMERVLELAPEYGVEFLNQDAETPDAGN